MGASVEAESSGVLENIAKLLNEISAKLKADIKKSNRLHK
jgi:hypothetical protein